MDQALVTTVLLLNGISFMIGLPLQSQNLWNQYWYKAESSFGTMSFCFGRTLTASGICWIG
jgi:hypothetical protein